VNPFRAPSSQQGNQSQRLSCRETGCICRANSPTASGRDKRQLAIPLQPLPFGLLAQACPRRPQRDRAVEAIKKAAQRRTHPAAKSANQPNQPGLHAGCRHRLAPPAAAARSPNRGMHSMQAWDGGRPTLRLVYGADHLQEATPVSRPLSSLLIPFVSTPPPPLRRVPSQPRQEIESDGVIDLQGEPLEHRCLCSSSSCPAVSGCAAP
jgi:hypothetical protein